MEYTLTYNHQSQFIEMTASFKDVVKLHDLVEHPVQAAKKIYKPSDTINYIDISSIDDGSKSFSKTTEYLFQDAPSRAQQCVENGDILYSTVRPNLRNFGYVMTENENLVASSGFCVLRAKDGLREYVFSVISSDAFTEKMVDKAQGGVFPAVNQSFVLDQEVPKVDKDTVEAISTIVRQADKSKFDGFKSQFIEMFGNPVNNDREWTSEPISKVAPESPAPHINEDYVWLLNLDMIESNTGQIIEKVIVAKEEVISAQPFDNGNVLFSKLRPYLNKVVSPIESGYATTELVPLRPDENRLDKTFFTYLLRSDQFVQFANDISGGTKMPRMPLKELREFKCILPPLSLQQEFAAIVRQADKSK